MTARLHVVCFAFMSNFLLPTRLMVIILFLQRSCSRDSFIRLAPASLNSPSPTRADGQQLTSSPCPSVDEMLLDTSSTSGATGIDSGLAGDPSAEILHPEPLWQLEFGSCWQRMRESPITSNPRDTILDLSHLMTAEESSAAGTDDSHSDIDCPMPSTSSSLPLVLSIKPS